MVEDLIKRLRDDAGLDGQKLLAADLLEQQAARIAELTTCKLCNSTGNSTPCAYPTEINRQQAKRLTALESERDALLAAAGKEAVAWIDAKTLQGFTNPQNGWRERAVSIRRGEAILASDVPIYTAPQQSTQGNLAPNRDDSHSAFEKYLNLQKQIVGMPGLKARPCFIAGYRAASAQSGDALTRDLLETLQMMVKHFTKTPSTLADSKARGRAHEVIAKAYEQIGYTAPTTAPEKGDGRDALEGVAQYFEDSGDPEGAAMIRRYAALSQQNAGE